MVMTVGFEALEFHWHGEVWGRDSHFWRWVRAGEVLVHRTGILGATGRRRVQRFTSEAEARSAFSTRTNEFTYEEGFQAARGDRGLISVPGSETAIEEIFWTRWRSDVEEVVSDGETGAEWVLLEGLSEAAGYHAGARFLGEEIDFGRGARVGSVGVVCTRHVSTVRNIWSNYESLGSWAPGDTLETARMAAALYPTAGREALSAARLLTHA